MADVVEMAQDLIRIPSPTGREGRIAAFVRDVLTWAGFQARVNDHGTVVAILRRGAGPTLVFDAHLDTVEAEAFEWTHHPFAGEIADDKLYGRGASDMKGALAAMMAAGQALARSPLQGTLILTGTSWEEHFEGHTLGLALEGLIAQGLRPDAVIIGEASEMNIKRGQRGRTRIHVDIQGQAAHSAHPERGINAVYKASDLIQAIRAMPLPHDDLLGDGIVELIGIHSFPEPVDSVVPYACRVSYDLRLLPGQTRESVLAQFGQIISALGRQDPSSAPSAGSPAAYWSRRRARARRWRHSLLPGSWRRATRWSRRRSGPCAASARTQPSPNTAFAPTAAIRPAWPASPPSAMGRGARMGRTWWTSTSG